MERKEKLIYSNITIIQTAATRCRPHVETAVTDGGDGHGTTAHYSYSTPSSSSPADEMLIGPGPRPPLIITSSSSSFKGTTGTAPLFLRGRRLGGMGAAAERRRLPVDLRLGNVVGDGVPTESGVGELDRESGGLPSEPSSDCASAAPRGW